MAADFDKLTAIRRFLKRTQTADQIVAIALAAFAAIQDGRTVTTVNFEGGGANSVINCEPHILLNACEDCLVSLGVSAPELSVVFTQFSGGFIQT